MRKRLEAALVAVVGLACAAFTAVLVRGADREEERDMELAWMRAWRQGRVEGLQELERDQVLRLPGAGEGAVVRVESGMVIVTREGDPEDHVLEGGAEIAVPRRGLTLVWAQRPSRVEVLRRGAQRSAERAGGSLSLAR